MTDGKKGDRSYVDGLTVKITEKYKRPPRIKLPVICQSCDEGPVIFDEYDFRLERSVLSKMADWKRARAEQANRREERRKAREKLEEAEKRKETSPTDSNEKDTEEGIVASAASSLPSDILTPVQVASVSQPNSNPIPHNFNFSEFESDNSSPFDNVELKTINDMEVLASVLSSSTENVPPTVSDKASRSIVNNNIIPNKNGMIWNKWEGYNTYSSPQYYDPSYNYQPAFSPVAYTQPPANYQHTWSGGDTSAYQISPYYPTPVPSSAHQFHDTGGTVPKAIVDSSNLQSQRSNSKSVPDLVLELEAELKEKQFFDEQRRKTKTPPPRPSHSKATAIDNTYSSSEFESSRHLGPDSIESLNPKEKLLARNLSEMGFPVSRIVRTIKKFKGDEKKAIEFLLQVQRLQENNYSGDLVERALHANEYDETKALKHLEAKVVLLDLGFEEDVVERVLLESNNDRDAALEKLIS